MALLLSIHPVNPQPRLIQQVAQAVWAGAVVVYPTDSGYALGTALGNKSGLERIRRIRRLPKHHDFTLMLPDLTHVGMYAKLNNNAFRLLKKVLPGAYTFIFQGTRDVPRRLLHKNKKTIGIRVSDHSIVQALLATLQQPMMSVSLMIEDFELFDIADVRAVVEHQVDMIVDAGYCPPEPTTVIDLSNHDIQVVRQGAGDTSFMI